MYEGPLQSNLIVTRNRNREIMQELQGVPCILCTLGLMSSSTLVQKTIFKIVPPIYVLVDEASQIKILDFMVRDYKWLFLVEFQKLMGSVKPIFLKCHRLQKMCFFGDPEQCEICSISLCFSIADEMVK